MSTPPLFFLAELPDGRSVDLDGDEGRHAARAMRLAVGEPVWVGDGSGALLDCAVSAVRVDGLGLEILGRRVVPVPDPWLVVVQAIPKGDRGELAVELMTELGVDEIVPWSATRSIAQWQGERGVKAQRKWRRTAREAAKQSRRARVPVVTELHTTAAVSTRLARGTSVVLHEAAGAALVDAALPSSGVLTLIVGPEGGIDDAELAAFGNAGASTVRLGASVLRTSTAGAAAAAVLSVRLGRWA